MGKKNIFVSKIFDVILATEEGKTASKDKDTDEIKGIFVVMEYVPNDLKKMIQLVEPDAFEEQHIKIIMYNLLCAINFLHSANIMHRDIKPANLLVDETCQIKLCDFGQARPVPGSVKQKISTLSVSTADNSPFSK
jgi:serine/threonine protein kinase